MKRWFYIFTAAQVSSLVFGGNATHAADREPIVLPPQSAWHLDMADNKCRLARTFGDASDPVIFFIEQWDPGKSAEWTVAGGPIKKYRASSKTSFAFGPDGDTDTFEPFDMTLGEYGRVISHKSTLVKSDAARSEQDQSPPRAGLPILDAEGAQGISTFTVSQSGRAAVTMELGAMKEPLKAMNYCVEDLVRSWGFDPDQQRLLTTPPVVSNMDEVTSAIVRTYPQAAEQKGAQANFHLRLTVDEGGQIQDCVLVNQTLAADFDMRRHPCASFRKVAKIEPARTKDGQPMRTYYAVRIAYRMR